MGKFDGVLLASDFDNTLIYTAGCMGAGKPIPPLSEKNRAAIQSFIDEGGRFSVATGRALPAFTAVASLVPFNAPCIICNGAGIYDMEAGEFLEFAAMDDSARDRAQAVLDAFPTVAVEAYHRDSTSHVVHPNDMSRRHVLLSRTPSEERASMADVPLPLAKLLFEEERPVLERVRQFMEDRGWAGDYELIHSADMLLEMTRKGASKGGMLSLLAERLGIRRDHVYAVGDEANDLSMMAAASRGFAPANCVEAVRQSGVTIVSDARYSAVADVIAILDQIY